MAAILGQLTCNEIKVLEVDGNPAAASGTVAPIGSLAVLQSTGQMWRKYASLDTEWTSIIYGSHYQYAESLGGTSNNSQTTYVSKVTLTTPSLPSGNYEVTLKSIYYHGTNGRQVQLSFLRNTVEFENYTLYVTSNQSRAVHYTKTLFTAISGVQTFDIQFRSVGNGTANLGNTSLSFRRVA